jgi:hypothetical protein
MKLNACRAKFNNLSSLKIADDFAILSIASPFQSHKILLSHVGLGLFILSSYKVLINCLNLL